MQGDDFKIQNFLKLGGAVTALCALLSGCLTQDQPPKLGPTNANTESSTNSGDSVHATGANTYTNAKSTKVIFNKKSFFTNFSPNSFGCPGDAQYYYSPETDRIVPSKPSWLKNISVDITNTNAINGPSRATGCGVYGGGAPPAANCATFDDLQPLDGLVSRSVLIGGIGCSSPGTNCTSTSTLSDIWHLQITDQATTTTWAPQAAIMPIISGTIPGTAWSGGDFDTLHDQFYVFGGAYDGGGTYTFTNKVVASYFNSDGTLSTANAPQTLAAGTPVYYGSWTSAAFVAGLANPIARVGATFTYSPRRDPTFKSWCPRGDGNCFSNTQAANAAVVNNENHDYFLMLGGMTTANTLSSEVYMYKPHGFSADVGTNSPSQGDWNLLSNDLLGGVRGSIMKIIDISTQISTGVGKFQGTTVNGTMPIGTTFSGLLPRAFHRSVYDPTMNRFYIYGGIKTSAGVNVTTVTPDLSSELWVYDPPALGRKPTSICSMTTSPEGNTLPTTVLSTRTRLGPNLNYSTNASVFPPGGCLQRISLQQSTPEARFEHAMAFDSDQKAVVVFGGCKQASTIATSGAALGGDPTSSCTSSSVLLNDVWMYVAPVVTEIATQSLISGLPNIFGTDFWLDHFFLHSNNSADNGYVTEPTTADVMGGWIHVTPSGGPTKRVSASMVYDRGHHKFYLFGGTGCVDTSCVTIKPLNDLWEYTPPALSSCDPISGSCATQGVWQKLQNNSETSITQPTIRKGAMLAYSQPMYSHADDFYTVTDTQCIGQGPIATFDSSISKQLVGAVYVDIDRTQFTSKEKLLINIRLLPFDKYTKQPGFYDNGTLNVRTDDTDGGSDNDQAVIRVQLLSSSLSFGDQIMSLIQPRFHEFLSGTPVIGESFVYVSGPSGQVTEKQVFVPLGLDPRINLIKIERVQGTVKFYEMSVYKY
jgi:hypothetical protein